VFRVFHVDGDLNNCRPANLKTVCSNCSQVLHKEGVKWRQGDLVPDL
jgi:predicted HNH restriction endonuclease